MSQESKSKPAESPTPEPVWCLAANVVLEREYGEDKEIRRGTKHFKPGAKVWIVDWFWGMGGDQLTVVGRHRKSGRFITLSMAAKHLSNLRAQLAYSPRVIGEVMKHHHFGRFEAGSGAQQQEAERLAESYASIGWPTQPFVTRGPLECPPDEE